MTNEEPTTNVDPTESDEQSNRMVIDVGDFIETLVERQARFEAAVLERLTKLEARTESTDAICIEQQAALKQAVQTLKELVLERTGWKRTGSRGRNPLTN